MGITCQSDRPLAVALSPSKAAARSSRGEPASLLVDGLRTGVWHCSGGHIVWRPSVGPPGEVVAKPLGTQGSDLPPRQF